MTSARHTPAGHGFILVEVIVAMLLMAIILTSMAGLTFQVARRSLRVASEAHIVGVVSSEAGLFSVLPFDSLPSAAGCDTILDPAFPYIRCTSVRDFGTKIRQVVVVVTPTRALSPPDSIVFRRTKPATPSPF